MVRIDGPLGRWVGVLLLALLPTLVSAKEAVVTLSDGRQLQGELLEQNEQRIVLSISGVRTTLNRSNIAHLRVLESMAKRYRQRRADLSEDDLAGRRELVHWLVEQKAYKLAAQELKTLRRRFPEDNRLTILWRVVQERLKLRRARESDSEAETQPTTQPADEPAPLRLEDRLSESQVNLMRVWEVTDPLESQPEVLISNEVIRELYSAYADHRRMPEGPNMLRRLMEAPGYEQLELMFRLQAREFYGRARMISDPEPLRQFRVWLHERYVLGFCARPQCHGGKAIGGLPLFRRQSATDRTFYSNFYSLSQYRNDAGLMIDRRRPSDSLLLQYGLPRAKAKRPHPEVENWRPHFFSAESREYQSYLGIIDGLYNRPQYTLDTELPIADRPITEQPRGEAPATQPAARTSPADDEDRSEGVIPTFPDPKTKGR
jgi:hypothetical protein